MLIFTLWFVIASENKTKLIFFLNFLFRFFYFLFLFNIFSNWCWTVAIFVFSCPSQVLFPRRHPLHTEVEWSFCIFLVFDDIIYHNLRHGSVNIGLLCIIWDNSLIIMGTCSWAVVPCILMWWIMPYSMSNSAALIGTFI